MADWVEACAVDDVEEEDVIRFDHGVHIGAVNLDVALGFETRADGLRRVALQLDAESHDAILVAKQTLGFLTHEGFERRSQLEMNAGDDDFAMVLAVHVSAYGLG